MNRKDEKSRMAEHALHGETIQSPDHSTTRPFSHPTIPQPGQSATRPVRHPTRVRHPIFIWYKLSRSYRSGYHSIHSFAGAPMMQHLPLPQLRRRNSGSRHVSGARKNYQNIRPPGKSRMADHDLTEWFSHAGHVPPSDFFRMAEYDLR